MFSRSKKVGEDIDPRQKELFEHAQERIKEKKSLYTHFIFYLVGCVFAIVLNILLNFGSEFRPFNLDWFVYVVLIWSFFMMIHAVRILLFSRFMGKSWEAKQMTYLVEKQKKKIGEMEEKLNLEIHKEAQITKNILLDNTKGSTNNTEHTN